MNIFGKFLFFISSYIPLLLIISVNTKQDKIIELPQFEYNNIIYNLEIPLHYIIYGISAFLITVSMAFLIWYLKYRNINSNKFKIESVENKTGENLTYILPYMVAFYQVDFSSINNIIVFLIMFITIFSVYINSNLISINPTLTMLGYKIYIVIVNKNQKIFLISKNNVSKYDKELRLQPVCCNIYIERKIRE